MPGQSPFGPSAGDSFDVLTAASITDNGLFLTGAGGFDFGVFSGGQGQVLRLTFVPEPGTLGVFVVVGLGFLKRRLPTRPGLHG